MKICKLLLGIRFLAILGIFGFACIADAAYDHGGADTDSAVFLDVYPDKAGTKLDSCALCHSGGTYTNYKGREVALGSCQWCHYSYGYDMSGNIEGTLNQFGKDYRDGGRDSQALYSIEMSDSDGDSYSNADEIAALRFPGNINDDPTKIAAPYRVFTRQELEHDMHTQFMLMNTHKSGDFYAEYSGVTIAELLDSAGILSSANGITVYAPDGWSQYHPLDYDTDPLLYHVYGSYPEADYYYNEQADEELSPNGWCDYSAPSNTGRSHGDPINNPNGLKTILAILRDGEYLQPGVLDEDNRLDGEGPFRVVPPQKMPGPPDQGTKADDPANPDKWIWPFDEAADHNAGFATRSATIIKVEPLPAGTTDIDTLEAGWNFVDESKILVYGAIDPVPTIDEKLVDLVAVLNQMQVDEFKRPLRKYLLVFQTRIMRRMINKNKFQPAQKWLENRFLKKVDGCLDDGLPDGNDWIVECNSQRQVYWALHEIQVLMNIIN